MQTKEADIVTDYVKALIWKHVVSLELTLAKSQQCKFSGYVSVCVLTLVRVWP